MKSNSLKSRLIDALQCLRAIDAHGLVIAERNRQRLRFDTRHDMHHAEGELERAADCYLGVEGAKWPFEDFTFKPCGPIRNLMKGAALLHAEKDRLVIAAQIDESLRVMKRFDEAVGRLKKLIFETGNAIKANQEKK